MFAALHIKGFGAKVTEGPVPGWKKFRQLGAAKGAEGADYLSLSGMATTPFLVMHPSYSILLKGLLLSPEKARQSLGYPTFFDPGPGLNFSTLDFKGLITIAAESPL